MKPCYSFLLGLFYSSRYASSHGSARYSKGNNVDYAIDQKSESSEYSDYSDDYKRRLQDVDSSGEPTGPCRGTHTSVVMTVPLHPPALELSTVLHHPGVNYEAEPGDEIFDDCRARKVRGHTRGNVECLGSPLPACPGNLPPVRYHTLHSSDIKECPKEGPDAMCAGLRGIPIESLAEKGLICLHICCYKIHEVATLLTDAYVCDPLTMEKGKEICRQEKEVDETCLAYDTFKEVDVLIGPKPTGLYSDTLDERKLSDDNCPDGYSRVLVSRKDTGAVLEELSSSITEAALEAEGIQQSEPSEIEPSAENDARRLQSVSALFGNNPPNDAVLENIDKFCEPFNFQRSDGFSYCFLCVKKQFETKETEICTKSAVQNCVRVQTR